MQIRRASLAKARFGLAILVLVTACDNPAPKNDDSSKSVVHEQESEPTNSNATSPLPALDRKTVMQARRQFKIDVLSFDASQQYGTEFPYSDRVRLRISNKSDVTLPCLTVLTKRYSAGNMVGSSRAPSIPTRDIAPGESVEYEYYPLGHLDVVSVDKIAAEVEGVVRPEDEEFICELQGLSSQSPSKSRQTASTTHQRIVVDTPADSIIAWRGKAISVRQTGQDTQGLLVEWKYSDAVYLLGRRLRNGIEAYRVIKITAVE